MFNRWVHIRFIHFPPISFFPLPIPPSHLPRLISKEQFILFAFISLRDFDSSSSPASDLLYIVTSPPHIVNETDPLRPFAPATTFLSSSSSASSYSTSSASNGFPGEERRQASEAGRLISLLGMPGARVDADSPTIVKSWRQTDVDHMKVNTSSAVGGQVSSVNT